MGERVDVVIEDARWLALNLDNLAERAFTAAAGVVDIPAGFGLCVMGCDDTRIATLNADFREKPVPTNVLSWPTFDVFPGPDGVPEQPPEPSLMEDSLGDIALAYETCIREADEKGIAPESHVLHLVVHGCLHLLGYDHQDDRQAEVMEGLEITALASMGLQNPY